MRDVAARHGFQPIYVWSEERPGSAARARPGPGLPYANPMIFATKNRAYVARRARIHVQQRVRCVCRLTINNENTHGSILRRTPRG